ncbi:hypothetical protein BC940DRAFT_302856 [Gongronella butleri]|nr:hypothetical protein BC940DRAFT_302856 [Gongronella butleri]
MLNIQQMLPNELLSLIFALLSKADLKSVRQCCSLFNELVCPFLFHTFLLRPLPSFVDGPFATAEAKTRVVFQQLLADLEKPVSLPMWSAVRQVRVVGGAGAFYLHQIAQLLQQCKSASSLEINGMLLTRQTNNDKHPYNYQLSDDAVALLKPLLLQSRLRNLRVSNQLPLCCFRLAMLPNLQHLQHLDLLDVGRTEYMTTERVRSAAFFFVDLVEIQLACPHLESFACCIIDMTPSSYPPAFFSKDNNTLIPSSLSWTSLASLRIHVVRQYHNTSELELLVAYLSSWVPHVCELDVSFSQSKWLHVPSLWKPSTQERSFIFSKLEHLKITINQHVAPLLDAFAQHAVAFTALTLHSPDLWPSFDLIRTLTQFQQLRTMDISNVDIGTLLDVRDMRVLARDRRGLPYQLCSQVGVDTKRHSLHTLRAKNVRLASTGTLVALSKMCPFLTTLHLDLRSSPYKFATLGAVSDIPYCETAKGRVDALAHYCTDRDSNAFVFSLPYSTQLAVIDLQMRDVEHPKLMMLLPPSQLASTTTKTDDQSAPGAQARRIRHIWHMDPAGLLKPYGLHVPGYRFLDEFMHRHEQLDDVPKYDAASLKFGIMRARSSGLVAIVTPSRPQKLCFRGQICL